MSCATCGITMAGQWPHCPQCQRIAFWKLLAVFRRSRLLAELADTEKAERLLDQAQERLKASSRP